MMTPRAVRPARSHGRRWSSHPPVGSASFLRLRGTRQAVMSRSWPRTMSERSHSCILRVCALACMHARALVFDRSGELLLPENLR